jgi:hypothetical protein
MNMKKDRGSIAYYVCVMFGFSLLGARMAWRLAQGEWYHIGGLIVCGTVVFLTGRKFYYEAKRNGK